MGNQREIQQISPFRCTGAVLKIRDGALGALRKYLHNLSDAMYTHLREGDGTVTFDNLDAPPTCVGPVFGTVVVIASGGKMWCGYDNFVAHIARMAPLLHDALFYIGDEEDYVDEFRIEGGILRYVRVHEGSWYDVRQFLADRASGGDVPK